MNRPSQWLLTVFTVIGLTTAAQAQTPPEIVQYYHLDALGSVRAVTDPSGAVVRTHDYRPFGEGENPTAGTDPTRFTGKERDTESGFDYVGARYYASRSGRFTTVDPGHMGGNIFDPQSWNAYAYARNNPLRFIDPTGTDYLVNTFGGESFWVETDRDLRALEQGGFSFRGGIILDSANTWVGTYHYFSPFARLAFDISRTAGPGVNAAVALGAVTTAIPAAAIGGGALVAGAGGQSFLLPMGGGMAAAMSAVQNPALREALNQIYRWQDKIAGGTAGAVRFTQQTGRLVGGSDHLGKLANSIGRLQNILSKEVLSPSDRNLAQAVLTQLKAAKP
jgi:RHS repeat-associated protein